MRLLRELGFSGDDYGYAIDLGLPPPPPPPSPFFRDPQINVEAQWTGETLGRSNAFALRHGPGVRIRGDDGEWRQVFYDLAPFDSMMTHCSDPRQAPELLRLLVSLGSCFDTASVAEIEMVLAAGATPDRISYGNTIKKERDIARAFALGIRLFAVDCQAEVEKIARAAPGATSRRPARWSAPLRTHGTSCSSPSSARTGSRRPASSTGRCSATSA